MRFEGAPIPEQKPSLREADQLASQFSALNSETAGESHAVDELERILESFGFDVATQTEVSQILNNPSLLCRSEGFTRTIDLVTNDIPVVIENANNSANMCVMASGRGFRTAMTEGFSGKDVGATVKTVLTFHGDHLDTQSKIPHQDDLWRTKPDTAAVSLVGHGLIDRTDVVMVSFRFPIHLFPESMLTEQEKDNLAEKQIAFIVRHYIPQNTRQEKTTH